MYQDYVLKTVLALIREVLQAITLQAILLAILRAMLQALSAAFFSLPE
jgi:hypothetical protein